MAPSTFYGEVSRLRTRRQEDLEKQTRKKSSSAPLPAAKGQPSIVGMENGKPTATSSSSSSSSSSSTSMLEPQPKPQPTAAKPKPKPKPKLAQPPFDERECTKEECERENKKMEDEILDYLLAVSKNLAHPLHPVYDDGNNGGVQWWEKRCTSTLVCTQVARMGADAYTMEEFWMKYGHPQLLDLEACFVSFFFFG